MNRSSFFLWLFFVVLPLRNKDYFDAMDDIERRSTHIRWQCATEAIYLKTLEDIDQKIRDRCAAVGYEEQGFRCLACRRLFESTRRYLLHVC